MSELAAGLTGKRLRETEAMRNWYIEGHRLVLKDLKGGDIEGAIQKTKDTLSGPSVETFEAALAALPKTQAEEDLVVMACRIKSAENQIQWCHDMLGKDLSGSDLSSVRISLQEAMRSLKDCREAGLE